MKKLFIILMLVLVVCGCSNSSKKGTFKHYDLKEVINLIDKLEQEGMSAEKIIEIIRYIETHDPQENHN